MKSITDKIDAFRKDKGMTMRDFEATIGVSNGLIAKLQKTGGSIGSDKIEAILHAFPEISADLLFDEQSTVIVMDKSDIMREPRSVYTNNSAIGIPIFDIEASAGTITVFDDVMNQKPIDHLYIPDAPKCDGAVYVRGDSMYPILKSGDMVCYKMGKDKVDGFIWGEIYLLEIDLEGDTMIVTKYVQRSVRDGYIILVSHNKHHQDKEIRLDQVRSFALVKLWIRKNII